MRGKPACRLPSRQSSRITPAGAGKTFVQDAENTSHRDHPRRCGENRQIDRFPVRQVGSPPQVRGKQVYDRRIVGCLRITPAGAGKTDISDCINAALKDHPRRCGENVQLFKLSLTYSGSPPQVRGKHNSQTVGKCKMRITPAGAGKTRTQNTHRE